MISYLISQLIKQSYQKNLIEKLNNFAFSIFAMLEDYCQKLQQLNKDKNEFIKLKYKTNAKTMVDKQENKYHKYILGQISHKNKLDSLLKLTQVFNQIVRQCQKPAFDLLSQKYCSSKTNDSSFASLLDKN
mgnify:CR=1 FL=1